MRTPSRYYDWSRVPVVLDTEQAGLLLQITPDRVARLCKAGNIPAARFGKGWRINRDVLRKRMEGEA